MVVLDGLFSSLQPDHYIRSRVPDLQLCQFRRRILRGNTFVCIADHPPQFRRPRQVDHVIFSLC